MFSKLAAFFIHNTKLTFILVIVILLAGTASYILIPKQYNPTIVVPAFYIEVPSFGLSAGENKNLILEGLEDRVMEIEGIDKIYGVAGDHFTGLMVQFEVGIEKEAAKIRLLQKVSEIQDIKASIKAIDPDELPQISYALSLSKKNTLSENEAAIYLRSIALRIEESLRTLPNLTTMELVGGRKHNIIIELNPLKVESFGLDILQIQQTLASNNLILPAGNVISGGEKIFIETQSFSADIADIKKLSLGTRGETLILLEDIADIRVGEFENTHYSRFASHEVHGSAVFLGIGKKASVNAVSFTQEVEARMNEISKTLPNDVIVTKIQDEGANAAEATSHLIKDLILSIVIVVGVLVVFLGFKNALNTATSIPLILALVFLFAYVGGDNINRITLFALILVIGMLVDDSIVVVENIHRHLEERVHTGKTKLEAILNATQEVGSGVILSTLTKIISFGAMFSVTGMMGEYMGPIPKYGIMALLFSILVAFTINPWVSYMTAPEVIQGETHSHKPSRYDIRKFYNRLMLRLISSGNASKKIRRLIKIGFWGGLILVIILPIATNIFKARMLPKSNQDQVYLWIDAPRSMSASDSEALVEAVEKIFLGKNILPENLQIVENISSTIGTPFLGDFSNLFRGGLMRRNEHELSLRINLIPKHHLKNRISSELFTIQVRPYLRDALLKQFPDIKIRLLEDPPGPPVRATFLAKIQSTAPERSLQAFSQRLYQKIQPLAQQEDIADMGISSSSTYKKAQIVIDQDAVARAGLSPAQVSQSLALLLSGQEIALLRDEVREEKTYLILGSKKSSEDMISLLKNVRFQNREGVTIPLSSIAGIEHGFVSGTIYTDEKKQSFYIYGEMADNSVVYPTVKLYSFLSSPEFLGEEYIVTKKNFYEIEFLGLKDGHSYTLVWDGEWKLTMDTFRDLGSAMILAIGLIYLLIVGQFRSFAVAGIIMLPFLLGFFGIFPGFSLLYLLKNEYFNATGMIGIISLAGIVVGNAILLIDYINILKERGWTIEKAIVEAGYVRFMPIMLTSISAILGAIKITSDPVWSGLAWSIVWGLSASAILTLILLPIFYYDSQRKNWE